jgi:hypothetical protein
MNNPSKHRVKAAIEKLRNTLTFEYFKNIPQYRNITKDQYFLLVKNYERICQIMLETYLESINE